METRAAVEALRALAHGSRLAVFRRLVAEGPAGLPAGAIAEALDLPGPTLSFHLAQLVQGGLVWSRREGRQVIYGVDVGGVGALVGFLTNDCCGGRAELCGLGPRTAAPTPKPRRARRTRAPR